MTVDVAKDFADRMNAIRDADNERFEWMKALHARIADLTLKYENASKDLEREQMAGRLTQGEAKNWQHQFEDLRRSVDDGSFVLVLIDADADEYIFQDTYYAQPEGGRKAAVALQAHVQHYLRKAKPALANLPIVIKAFANADGLSKLLVNVKMIQSPISLWDFAKSFSQAHAMSDFILVGNGKDRADEKIKGVFEQSIRNPTCCHIVFGACHDNGYVRVLEKYAGDTAIARRVTLLHSFDVGREFSALNFQSTRLNDLFRTTSLEILKAAAMAAQSANPRMENGQKTFAKTGVALAKVKGVSDKKVLSADMKDPYVAVLVNEAGQRVDAKLPQPSQAALDSWNRKVNVARVKFCRKHFFHGNCKGCNYSHGPLSEEEKVCFRRYVRAEVCHTGSKCRDADCYYGHSCPCKKQKCAFSAEMHRVDESTAEVWIGL